ncbi:hypothetical protein [Taibaiella helva]|uniref:hypothetical protein n=1 Tax=Taibaiella helva TaxID=2301235 RepID=UPI000E5861D7|nr:hypothetical protein [Taibaiella helva]
MPPIYKIAIQELQQHRLPIPISFIESWLDKYTYYWQYLLAKNEGFPIKVYGLSHPAEKVAFYNLILSFRRLVEYYQHEVYCKVAMHEYSQVEHLCINAIKEWKQKHSNYYENHLILFPFSEFSCIIKENEMLLQINLVDFQNLIAFCKIFS